MFKVGSPGRELQETDNSDRDNKLIVRSKHGDNIHGVQGKTEPGLWGPDGILAVPHVKMVLVLVCVLEVRDAIPTPCLVDVNFDVGVWCLFPEAPRMREPNIAPETWLLRGRFVGTHLANIL